MSTDLVFRLADLCHELPYLLEPGLGRSQSDRAGFDPGIMRAMVKKVGQGSDDEAQALGHSMLAFLAKVGARHAVD